MQSPGMMPRFALLALVVLVCKLGSAAAITQAQFRCVFASDGNSAATVNRHWRHYSSAAQALRFSFANDDEASIFFGNLKHEYGGKLSDMTEICSRVTRSGTNCPQYNNCNQPGNRFYGRGPIQLSHCYNYKAMGRYVGADLVANPDLVSDSTRDIGWRTALAFWTAPDFNCQLAQGGAMTCPVAARTGNAAAVTRRINPIECGATPQQRTRLRQIQLVRRTCFNLPELTANTLC